MEVVKAIHSLKSSVRFWHDRFFEVLTDMGFCPSKAEPNIWMRAAVLLPPHFLQGSKSAGLHTKQLARLLPVVLHWHPVGILFGRTFHFWACAMIALSLRSDNLSHACLSSGHRSFHLVQFMVSPQWSALEH
jgi:hypothetical protein